MINPILGAQDMEVYRRKEKKKERNFVTLRNPNIQMRHHLTLERMLSHPHIQALEAFTK